MIRKYYLVVSNSMPIAVCNRNPGNNGSTWRSGHYADTFVIQFQLNTLL